ERHGQRDAGQPSREQRRFVRAARARHRFSRSDRVLGQHLCDLFGGLRSAHLDRLRPRHLLRESRGPGKSGYPRPVPHPDCPPVTILRLPRTLRVVLMTTLALIPLAGCGDDTTAPTSTAPLRTTEVYSGTLNRGESGFYSFNVVSAGTA